MNFKYDWFSDILPAMERHVPRGGIEVLEIGSFEGRSTRWFLERGAIVTAVDHFNGGEDQSELELDGLFSRFAENVDGLSANLRLMKMDSWDAFHMLPNQKFDIVFVDGSHLMSDVLHDVVQAYRVVKIGGRLLFDDYSWGPERSDRPQIAIDAFISCFDGRVKVLEKGRLAALERLC